jgi:hypothetical protein
MKDYQIIKLTDPRLMNDHRFCDRLRGLRPSVIELGGDVSEWAWHSAWPALFNDILSPMLFEGAVITLRGW